MGSQKSASGRESWPSEAACGLNFGAAYCSTHHPSHARRPVGLYSATSPQSNRPYSLGPTSPSCPGTLFQPSRTSRSLTVDEDETSYLNLEDNVPGIVGRMRTLGSLRTVIATYMELEPCFPPSVGEAADRPLRLLATGSLALTDLFLKDNPMFWLKVTTYSPVRAAYVRRVHSIVRSRLSSGTSRRCPTSSRSRSSGRWRTTRA